MDLVIDDTVIFEKVIFYIV